LKNKKAFFLIGVGGIGMSSIAQHLIFKGYNVFGYDRNSSSITDLLEEKGVLITFSHSVNYLIKGYKIDNIKVIYSAAIKINHPVFRFFIDRGCIPTKRSVFLASLVNETESFAVAGTHGKTTTSAILTHIFKKTDTSFSSFVGGVMLPEKTNYIHNGFDKTIVEADEFDRSFLNLKPHFACITSIDADHLDIYKNHDQLKAAFIDFSQKVQNKLILHHSIPIDGISYGLNTNADYEFKNINQTTDGYFVDLKTPNEYVSKIFCKVLGKYNLENMLAALALADQSGKPLVNIIQSLGSFHGILRRMNSYNLDGKIIIDDYAHHPTEIASVHKALREKYPDSFIEVVFQPHLFSRTRDFMNDFAYQLSKFDSVKLMKIYPAREAPIKGVNSEKVLKKITTKASLLERKNFNKNLDLSKADVIAILGAGSIGNNISEYIKEKSI
jgi:UDP-N-acetylmuramate--alanine ligase